MKKTPLDFSLGLCHNGTRQEIVMDKDIFVKALTEACCDELRLRVAVCIDGELRGTQIAPLEDDDVGLLVEFEERPRRH